MSQELQYHDHGNQGPSRLPYPPHSRLASLTSIYEEPAQTALQPMDFRSRDRSDTIDSTQSLACSPVDTYMEDCYNNGFLGDGFDVAPIPSTPFPMPSMKLDWLESNEILASSDYSWTVLDNWTPSHGQGRSYYQSQTYPKRPSSVQSVESESGSRDSEGWRHVCGECYSSFGSSLALDQHAKRSSHKPWWCPEVDCDKSYARRDVFLRHKATHRDGGHTCGFCPRGKAKVFKRKDHLREHVKKCHNEREASGLRNLNAFDSLVQNAVSESESECSVSIASGEIEAQRRNMNSIVRTLKDMLGGRQQAMIKKLEDRVMELDDLAAFESLAENMASVALFQANIDAAKSHNAGRRAGQRK